MKPGKLREQAGLSLVELLVALTITLAVAGLACALAIEAQAVWRADSARLDLQQRARVAVDVLARSLREAGRGPHAGSAAGPLLRSIAPVIPRRTGARRPDPPDSFRADAFSIIRAAAEVEPAALLLPAPAGTGALELSPGCAQPACGMTASTHVLLTDEAGNYDVFTITSVLGEVLTVRHHGPGSASAYAAGTAVVPVETASFFHDRDERTLREYDGDASDLPLLDDLVDMRVEYFGEGHPPEWPRPLDGAANCLYAADGGYNAVLMPVLSPPGRLVPLPAGLLTDGPWCGGGNNSFDADLLRVRRIRITLRLQASDPAARGLDPARFHHPGSARKESLLVPDITATIDVAPPNLRRGR